ncbi:Uncharacterized protein BM_BM7887 [Brugia malayi]|nr:Uncharacterized protein BM_BM7887 [Brugia malayi]VIO89318.1 Uncharacterized protein BM_BM7887 [Brugia malayi]
MCLLLCMFFLLVLNKSALCYAVTKNSGRNGRDLGHSEQYIKQIFYTHGNCIHSDWACNQECRLEYVNRTTGLCISPSPTESCFGIPILYNYTLEAASVIAILPKYEILSKFPRCWSSLGPLLCAVAYRPCSNRAYFEVSMDKPGTMELWQVFRKDMCQQAIEKCGFLLENDLWPSFINCSDTIKSKDGRRIFSDGSCAMTYNKEPSKMEPKQCLWPLAVGISHKPLAQPLIDDCYLPCRPPLISSQWLYDGFRMSIFSFSLLIVVGGLVSALYLFIFSLLFTSDLCVYSLTHALLSASVHWFIWLLSYADRVAERAMCFDMLRRDAKILRALLDWCSIQFWLLYTTILSGFFWLLIALAIQIGQPKLSSNQTIKWNKHYHLNLRCFFLICYLAAGSMATIALWADTIETNGITGVCYFGFHTVRSAMNLYGPVLVTFILCLIAIIYFRKCNGGSTAAETSNSSKKREQIALVVDHVSGDNEELFDCRDVKKNGYSQMAFFWRGLLSITIGLSFVASAVLLHYSFFTDAVSEQKVILDSVRCSLNKTIMEGQMGWLHGMMYDLKADVFSRLESIGNNFLSAPGCELPSIVDDQLLPMFLVYLFFPSLPFITVIIYVLAGFFGYGMVGIEKIRNKFNPFVLVKCSEFAVTAEKQQPNDALLTPTFKSSVKVGQSQKEESENIKQSENYEDESLDTFPTDLKIRRLDVLQRSKERRKHQMESGYLFLKPADSSRMTASLLSAYQNGVIEGQWRERCVNYEKQIKALSANLRVADHEIRRLAGLEMSESMITSRKRKSPFEDDAVVMNYSSASTAAVGTPLISTKFRLHSSKDARSLVSDNGHANNSWTMDMSLSKKPASSQDVHMQNKLPINEGNGMMICQPSSLKSRTFFGASTMQGLSDEPTGVDAGQLSESYHDSDSFNSDEEDSEEERLYNEKVAKLQRDSSSKRV